MHEDQWERSYARLDLTPDAVRAMLAPLAPDAGQPEVLRVEPLSGGRCNTNLRVTLAGQAEPVVLRVYVRGDAYCQIECDAFALVRGTVPVPAILYADPTGARFGRPYAVEQWVPGTRLDTVLAAPGGGNVEALGESVGATLAAIHAHPFAQAGFFGPGLTITQPMAGTEAVYAGHVGELLAQPGTRAALGAELAARLETALPALAAHLAVLDTGPVTLVHGDYKGSNILIDGPLPPPSPAWSGPLPLAPSPKVGGGARQPLPPPSPKVGGGMTVAAVLDWEFVHAGAGLLDLSILLRNMVLLPEARAAAFERGVERGYRAGGGWLPTDWRWLAEVFDLINLVQFAAVAPAGSLQARELAEAIARTLEGAKVRGPAG